jgi:hypothetical protein
MDTVRTQILELASNILSILIADFATWQSLLPAEYLISWSRPAA